MLVSFWYELKPSLVYAFLTFRRPHLIDFNYLVCRCDRALLLWTQWSQLCIFHFCKSHFYCHFLYISILAWKFHSVHFIWIVWFLWNCNICWWKCVFLFLLSSNWLNLKLQIGSLNKIQSHYILTKIKLNQNLNKIQSKSANVNIDIKSRGSDMISFDLCYLNLKSHII